MTRSDEVRFFDSAIPVPMAGCWLWTGGLSGSSYGRFRVAGRQIQAHRFSWELHKGPISDGLLVCHTCDVRCCVNPDHLFLGTQSENLRDMVRKGRDNPRRGERNGQARLTEEAIAAIRADLRPLADIGRAYGIDKQRVHKIKHGKHWRHSWAGISACEQDRQKRGQSIRARGERHHKAKLNTEQIIEIRSSTLSLRKLAAHYGVSKHTILHIKQRKIWKHVP